MTTLIIDGDPLLFRVAFNSKNVSHARERYEERLLRIQNECFSEDYVMAVFGDNNFRVSFDKEYKNTNSRKNSKANNPYYFELRKQLIEEDLVTPAHNMEADDLVRIWAEEHRAKGMPFIIVSVDKDLQCIPGAHYLIHHSRIIHMEEDAADLFYWTQILTGDSVDNIKGLPNIGPVKAGRILEGTTNSKQRKQRVIDAYYEICGDNWKKEMLHTGTLIHIMRTKDDMFSLKEDDAPTGV
jgi:5'-3' exonuclease